MAETSARPTWERCWTFLLDAIPAGAKVLDVGCGDGRLMRELAARGCSVSGIEVTSAQVAATTAAGLQVTLGCAEALPIPDASVDVIVCSVVLPYTDERRAVAEWARVLRPGGMVNVTCHGPGYALDYLTRGVSPKQWYYGLRMLANTLFYRLTARRLAGHAGDTLFQTGKALRRYYRELGLILELEEVIGTRFGLSQYLGHRVRKKPDLASFRIVDA